MSKQDPTADLASAPPVYGTPPVVVTAQAVTMSQPTPQMPAPPQYVQPMSNMAQPQYVQPQFSQQPNFAQQHGQQFQPQYAQQSQFAQHPQYPGQQQQMMMQQQQVLIQYANNQAGYPQSQYTNNLPQPPQQVEGTFGMQPVQLQGPSRNQMRGGGTYRGEGFASNSMRNLQAQRKKPCFIPACAMCCAGFICLLGLLLYSTGQTHLEEALALSPEEECRINANLNSYTKQTCVEEHCGSQGESCACQRYESRCLDIYRVFFTWIETDGRDSGHKYYSGDWHDESRYRYDDTDATCEQIKDAESSRAAAPMINWNNDTLVDCWKPTVDPEDVPWMYRCGNDECMKIGDPANDANGAESLARGLILAGTIVAFIGVVGCAFGAVIAGSSRAGGGFNFT
ncbi:hypothetical protein TL16_g02116 [Triparma laevis f. inornata]|uniref:Uncharacterized protein n=1 Tax=Triparma laevis f. inornata TaxID=1714386 RepID=A0A9W6ZTF7_9STRA|nr:hypothetical protein TL16_g02116 [Triparma laevis f. inornata]